MLSKIKNWLFGSSEKEEEKTENKQAYHETRKISNQGGSYYINMPKEWFEKNGINPEEVDEVELLFDSDLLIINPGRESEVKKKIGEATYEVYQDEKKET
jgi:antitoxin component of MazEF toxin-antitoxin module